MRTKLCLLILLLSTAVFSQTHQAYQDGEWLKFRIHYGWFNASFATLSVNETVWNEQKIYHITGHGESTGVLDLFFEVDDTYETYISKDTHLPLKFVRNINEGGYKKNKTFFFRPQKNKVAVVDHLKDTRKTFRIKNRTQDLLSAFYFLRSAIEEKTWSAGDTIALNLFFDEENYNFICKYLKTEVINTKFGKIKCMKFRPIVQAGRVFKEKESLSIWVSADKNHVPIKIKAKLAVGSLEADLTAFKGLKHPFKIVVD